MSGAALRDLIICVGPDILAEKKPLTGEVWVVVPGEKPTLPLEEVLVSRRLLDGVGREYDCFIMAAGGLELVGCFELN